MTFLRCLPLAALGLGLTGPALAAEMRYRIDPAHSHAEFAVSHMGISTFHGKMTAINGTIRLDPETGAGQIEAQLDAEALVTGDASLDRVLRGPEYFNTEQFPSLRFVASKLTFAQGKLQQAEGELTLLGQTRPVTLQVEHTGCVKNFFTKFRDTCGADATVILRRSEFGMTRFPSLIGDEVKVNIAIEATVEQAKTE